MKYNLTFTGKDDETVDSKLLSPYILKSCCFLPKVWRRKIQINNDETQVGPK